MGKKFPQKSDKKALQKAMKKQLTCEVKTKVRALTEEELLNYRVFSSSDSEVISSTDDSDFCKPPKPNKKVIKKVSISHFLIFLC